jgi:prevent-host-death family protein
MNSGAISVPLAEAKSKLSELIERVGQGEEFIITRHDTEMARLSPVNRPSRGEAAESIARMRAGRATRSASAEELRLWRDEGRR